MHKLASINLFVCLAISLSGIAHAEIFIDAAQLDRADDFALNPVFDPVGLMVGTNATGNSFVAGSGVLIEQDWVVFAAHSTFDGTTPWESLRFSTSPDTLNNLDTFIGLDAVFTFPDYVAGTPAGQGVDIALGRLSAPMAGVTPATRFRGQDVVGSEMLMSGYGFPGVWPNVEAFDGIRRAGRNTIDSFGRVFGVTTVQEQYFVTDLDLSSFDNPLDLEWQSSGGDSGGGWFVGVNGEYQLAGVTNGALFGYSHSFALRTSLYNDWIDQTISANSVPEPGSAIVLLCAGVGFGLRRRRSGSRITA